MRDGEWAVVTGASGGIGGAFVERLARDGLNIVMAARSTDAMETLAVSLRSRHGVEVDVVGCDLATPEGRDALLSATASHEVGVLINNAGFGTVGDFVTTDPERMLREISLNCAAVAMLSRAYAPAMAERRRGAIVNVSSTTAFQPIPSMAVYAATKAFVLSLTQAMWDELRPYGVSVLALCPGATETEFFATAGDEGILSIRRAPEHVVETCFQALRKGKPTAIDGPMYQALALAAKMAPARVAMPIAKRVLHT